MWRRVAVVTLLLGGLCVSLGAPPPAARAMRAAQPLYFPLVVHQPLPLEVVVTSRYVPSPWGNGYPTNYYVYGYVRNWSTRPVHGVVLKLEETVYSYDPYDASGSQSHTVNVRTALTATLPGQINPFSRDLLLGKATASHGDIYLGEGRFPTPDDPVIVALKAGEWEHEDRTLRGTVRNGSAYPVRGVRVVVTTLGDCSWRAATPEATRLLPGEETAFVADYFYSGCLDEGVVVLGQGVAETEP